MKIIRILAAGLVMLVLLHLARTGSMGQPEHVTRVDGSYSFDMTTVPKILENQSDTIRVNVTGPMQGKSVEYRTSQRLQTPSYFKDDFDRLLMNKSPDKPNEYVFEVTAGDRGGRFYYYFEVVDSSGAALARFTQPNNEPFLLKYIGEVPKFVIAAHLLFMFATVFFVALALIDAIKVIRGSEDIRPMAVSLFFAALCCFLGGYPFGIPMNYYAFNGSWEGVPFGTDATDNKTQLLFLYLLFAALTTLGSFSRGRFGRDLFAPRTRGFIGLSTFVVMLFIYLIPHSIQFPAWFTYAFCYTWIGVVAALYVLGRLKNRAAIH
jgi:hypothetical protein